jgi:hypothetical protein
MAIKMLYVPQRTMRIMKLVMLGSDDTDDGVGSGGLYVPEDDQFADSYQESIYKLVPNVCDKFTSRIE